MWWQLSTPKSQISERRVQLRVYPSHRNVQSQAEQLSQADIGSQSRLQFLALWNFLAAATASFLRANSSRIELLRDPHSSAQLGS